MLCLVAALRLLICSAHDTMHLLSNLFVLCWGSFENTSAPDANRLWKPGIQRLDALLAAVKPPREFSRGVRTSSSFNLIKSSEKKVLNAVNDSPDKGWMFKVFVALIVFRTCCCTSYPSLRQKLATRPSAFALHCSRRQSTRCRSSSRHLRRTSRRLLG